MDLTFFSTPNAGSSTLSPTLHWPRSAVPVTTVLAAIATRTDDADAPTGEAEAESDDDEPEDAPAPPRWEDFAPEGDDLT